MQPGSGNQRQSQCDAKPQLESFHSSHLGDYCFVITSSRLRIRLAIVVYAANSATFSPSSFRLAPMASNRVASLEAPLKYFNCASRFLSKTRSSFSLGRREVVNRKAQATRSSGSAPPSVNIRAASILAASTYATSFIRFSAWSGVLVRVSRTVQYSRAEASKTLIAGGITVRFQNV